jgi:hypothetical protein
MNNYPFPALAAAWEEGLVSGLTAEFRIFDGNQYVPGDVSISHEADGDIVGPEFSVRLSLSQKPVALELALVDYPGGNLRAEANWPGAEACWCVLHRYCCVRFVRRAPGSVASAIPRRAPRSLGAWPSFRSLVLRGEPETGEPLRGRIVTKPGRKGRSRRTRPYARKARTLHRKVLAGSAPRMGARSGIAQTPTPESHCTFMRAACRRRSAVARVSDKTW